MRLVCPSCKANYEVPRTAVPIGGREVQCASCGHKWFQTRTKKATDEKPTQLDSKSGEENNVEIETIDVFFNTRKYGQSKWKNNFINFISHIIFNILYLFRLRIFKK